MMTGGRSNRQIHSYRYRVIMLDWDTDEPLESVNAYKSQERAQEACDWLNTSKRYDSGWQKWVYYEVVAGL